MTRGTLVKVRRQYFVHVPWEHTDAAACIMDFDPIPPGTWVQVVCPDLHVTTVTLGECVEDVVTEVTPDIVRGYKVYRLQGKLG